MRSCKLSVIVATVSLTFQIKHRIYNVIKFFDEIMDIERENIFCRFRKLRCFYCSIVAGFLSVNLMSFQCFLVGFGCENFVGAVVEILGFYFPLQYLSDFRIHFIPDPKETTTNPEPQNIKKDNDQQTEITFLKVMSSISV